jgi:hypothetical protein
MFKIKAWASNLLNNLSWRVTFLFLASLPLCPLSGGAESPVVALQIFFHKATLALWYHRLLLMKLYKTFSEILL